MEWKNWLNVAFTERSYLPSCPGVYIVADALGNVWYVGQATNIKARWAGKTHHRYPQLIRSNSKRGYRIYWKELTVSSLIEQEKYYITLFKPELNGCRVKKYLPKQPQVEAEIKRLLKVLNSPTFLFPIVRSVVAGEYEDNDGTRCIVILTNINDERIISNSRRKKHSPQVRNAWAIYNSSCGRDEQYYQSITITTYGYFKYRFEFIGLPAFLFYLEENIDVCEQYVGTIELLGVKVKAIKYLDILRELPIEEEYISTNYEGKKCLRNIDYLNYLTHIIKCLR